MAESTISKIVMSGESILSAENSGNPLGSRGSATNPGGGAHSAPSDSLAVARVAVPSKNPIRALGLSVFPR